MVARTDGNMNATGTELGPCFLAISTVEGVDGVPFGAAVSFD